MAGETVTIADFDMDGFMDLFITNGLNYSPIGVGGPVVLYRNSGNANHWIEFDLVGTSSNRDGIGARVYVTGAGGAVQLREQNGGYHRNAQNFKRIHFGLGPAKVVDSGVTARVVWPSGVDEVFADFGVNRIHQLIEGSGRLSTKENLNP